MPIFDLNQKVVQQPGGFFGLVLLLLITAGCGNIIEIVPIEAPTPVAVSQLSSNLNLQPPQTGRPVRLVAKTIELDTPVVEMGWRLVENRRSADQPMGNA